MTYSRKIIKGLKPHKCNLCGLQIRTAATHWRFTGIGEDGWYSLRAHLVCEGIANAFDQDSYMDAWEYCFDYEAEFRLYSLELPFLGAIIKAKE